MFVLNSDRRVCATAYSMLSGPIVRAVRHGQVIGAFGVQRERQRRSKAGRVAVLCDIVLCADPRNKLWYDFDDFSLDLFYHPLASLAQRSSMSLESLLGYSFDASDPRRPAPEGREEADEARKKEAEEKEKDEEEEEEEEVVESRVRVGGVCYHTMLVAASVQCELSGKRFEFARCSQRQLVTKFANLRLEHTMAYGYSVTDDRTCQ